MKVIYLIIIVFNQFESIAQHSNIVRPSRDQCDDGRTGLEVDWNGSPVNYTCYALSLPVLAHLKHIQQCDSIHPGYVPPHYCMSTKLTYPEVLPTHAGHRPVYPAYGEYLFIPVHRWTHAIEHGALVMLYHPCADQTLVNQLRRLVVNCLRKHVISAYNLMPEDRPLALVAWGCRLLMSRVDPRVVIPFIRQKALGGPEGHASYDGDYNFKMIRPAKIVPGSDFEDNVLCP